MMKVLVVGGCGYVGGYLVDLMRADKRFDVTVYDNLMYESRYLKDVNFIFGDVRDKKKLEDLYKNGGFHSIIWLAAVVGDAACAVDPFLTEAINVDSVKHLVDNFKGKIIFLSTCSVYGINNDLIDETAAPNPVSLYGETKLEAEQYVLKNAPDSLVFRLGTLFGLGDEHSRIRLDLVVNYLTKLAVEGKELTVYGGQQFRPILHVRDVAEAAVYGIKGNIEGLYNLSSANYTIAGLADVVAEIMNVGVAYHDIPFEDLRNYRVKNDKWLNTGWESQWGLEQGICQIAHVLGEGRIRNPEDPIYSNASHLNKHYWRIDRG